MKLNSKQKAILFQAEDKQIAKTGHGGSVPAFIKKRLEAKKGGKS